MGRRRTAEIHRVTDDYENWLVTKTTVVGSGLKLKHVRSSRSTSTLAGFYVCPWPCHAKYTSTRPREVLRTGDLRGFHHGLLASAATSGHAVVPRMSE